MQVVNTIEVKIINTEGYASIISSSSNCISHQI
jgi:hypothetical protein